MLASEFQEKQRKQAQEAQNKAKSGKGPQEHPEDTLVVKNILVDHEKEVQEAIPYAKPRRDANHPTAGTDFDFSRVDTNVYEHSWNTKDFFEVRWDGRPHRIKPGQRRFFPRYLANHFAKNLIDFILTERQEEEEVTGLVKNRAERAKLYKRIVIGVASYYNGDPLEDERDGLRVERQVEQLNTGDALDVGPVENPALGYGTTDEPPEKVEKVEDTKRSGKAAKSQQDLIKSRSINELRSEAKQLGIEVKNNMGKEELAAAIFNF